MVFTGVLAYIIKDLEDFFSVIVNILSCVSETDVYPVYWIAQKQLHRQTDTQSQFFLYVTVAYSLGRVSFFFLFFFLILLFYFIRIYLNCYVTDVVLYCAWNLFLKLQVPARNS